jgi:hypothetical protein
LRGLKRRERIRALQGKVQRGHLGENLCLGEKVAIRGMLVTAVSLTIYEVKIGEEGLELSMGCKWFSGCHTRAFIEKVLEVDKEEGWFWVNVMGERVGDKLMEAIRSKIEEEIDAARDSKAKLALRSKERSKSGIIQCGDNSTTCDTAVGSANANRV